MGGNAGGGGNGGREGGKGMPSLTEKFEMTKQSNTPASLKAAYDRAADLHGELINKGAPEAAIKAALAEKKAARAAYRAAVPLF